MQYSFTCKGHPNIRATHPTTIEFTKDTELSRNGDCIVGISADFSVTKIKGMFSKDQVTVTLTCENDHESITCVPNPQFTSEHELVLRKSNFTSERTFGTNASKGSQDLNRKLIKLLQKPQAQLRVTIHD